MNDALNALQSVLDSRRHGDPESSYVASLHHKGLNKILEKVGEEGTEFILACKDDDKANAIYEAADLWFHSLVALSHMGLSAQDVTQELERRFAQSGLTEKANRSPT